MGQILQLSSHCIVIQEDNNFNLRPLFEGTFFSEQKPLSLYAIIVHVSLVTLPTYNSDVASYSKRQRHFRDKLVTQGW
jgi:hypothetical protein